MDTSLETRKQTQESLGRSAEQFQAAMGTTPVSRPFVQAVKGFGKSAKKFERSIQGEIGKPGPPLDELRRAQIKRTLQASAQVDQSKIDALKRELAEIQQSLEKGVGLDPDKIATMRASLINLREMTSRTATTQREISQLNRFRKQGVGSPEEQSDRRVRLITLLESIPFLRAAQHEMRDAQTVLSEAPAELQRQFTDLRTQFTPVMSDEDAQTIIAEVLKEQGEHVGAKTSVTWEEPQRYPEGHAKWGEPILGADGKPLMEKRTAQRHPDKAVVETAWAKYQRGIAEYEMRTRFSRDIEILQRQLRLNIEFHPVELPIKSENETDAVFQDRLTLFLKTPKYAASREGTLKHLTELLRRKAELDSKPQYYWDDLIRQTRRLRARFVNSPTWQLLEAQYPKDVKVYDKHQQDRLSRYRMLEALPPVGPPGVSQDDEKAPVWHKPVPGTQAQSTQIVPTTGVQEDPTTPKAKTKQDVMMEAAHQPTQIQYPLTAKNVQTLVDTQQKREQYKHQLYANIKQGLVDTVTVAKFATDYPHLQTEINQVIQRISAEQPRQIKLPYPNPLSDSLYL